ncbi:phytanoyl-CoA dioxygenase family protein [Actinopolymorpha pittospori]|uniref:Ectoine hydroxylase-related dioxygenase (Phytanoyl-CoA dioxygenase family) n=1 Tax=Actinopolymorpha pittospori TaxID=648752 RepID=A0A927MWU5_9ACTN|nr:phytanoyl-CoA dioxygenase family protein [Actinopolymorpha pittospori]MBE1608376.1 ectoine hydroxylase-related dioxygenase (phytanoyl-CoA dioxygenase family) [Actinopolymorpha pittospori]
MTGQLSTEQWESYDEHGYVVLDKVLDDADLRALQQRIDDIMLGRADLDYDRMLMQLDSSSGAYADAGKQSKGFKGATLDYRKIQDLEFDPLFLAYMQRPLFAEICQRVYGDIPVTAFRAMFMNKPARHGTFLPWHQDRWAFLDRDPLITVWTALDPATVANGCVQVIPGSHKYGLINPEHGSGFLDRDQATTYCPAEKVTHLELEAGQAVLLHNWLVHSSDINNTEISRRAFSVCYMDGRTRHTKGRENYSLIFGEGALQPGDLQVADTSR